MEKVSFVDNEGAFRWSLLQVSSKFDYFRLLRKLRLAQILTNLSLFASLTGSNGLRQGELFLSLASTVHKLTLEYNFSYTRVSASSLLTLMNSSLFSRRSSKFLLPLSEHTHSLTMSIKLDLLCYPPEALLREESSSLRETRAAFDLRATLRIISLRESCRCLLLRRNSPPDDHRDLIPLYRVGVEALLLRKSWMIDSSTFAKHPSSSTSPSRLLLHHLHSGSAEIKLPRTWAQIAATLI